MLIAWRLRREGRLHRRCFRRLILVQAGHAAGKRVRLARRERKSEEGERQKRRERQPPYLSPQSRHLRAYGFMPFEA
jgi:hypothetical protein